MSKFQSLQAIEAEVAARTAAVKALLELSHAGLSDVIRRTAYHNLAAVGPILSGVNDAVVSTAADEQDRIDEYSQALVFAADVPAFSKKPALRARIVQAALHTRLYAGTPKEAEWKAELTKLLKDPEIVSYLKLMDETRRD